jgi:predicted dehydrogenase
VDSSQILKTRQRFGDALARAREYEDYRVLLDTEKSLDALVIATADHWHARICKAAMLAGKHVFCEKPLTRTIGEAREMRELSRKCKVVTQTGNQGSASDAMRRCVELIEAGVLGHVREVYAWQGRRGGSAGVVRPQDADPVPAGLNWEFWLGPSPARPYKASIYHPGAWRHWYDFGSGSLGDFCCHMFNLPVRALKLDYPDRIEVSSEWLGRESFPGTCSARFHFSRRSGAPPVTFFYYYGEDAPPAEITSGVVNDDGKPRDHGCVLVGDKGRLSVGLWNVEGQMMMKGERAYQGVAEHPAAQDAPRTLPRVAGHMREWIDACKGGPKVYSDFDCGGHLTEVGLAGVLALRLGCDIDWDGEAMVVRGHPEAARLVTPEYREEWRD